MGWKSGYIITVAGNARELTSKTVKIGREAPGKTSDEATILLPGQSVSRHHATLKWQLLKSCYLLIHESATNPTVVNGEPAQRILLAPGDRIQIGDTTLVLSKAGAPLEAQPGQSAQETLLQLHSLQKREPSRMPLELEVTQPSPSHEPPAVTDKPGFKWVPPEDRA